MLVLPLIEQFVRSFLFSLQVDEFEIKALDIGPISKVVVGHKSQGRGNGWMCERLSVRTDKDEDHEVVFPVNSWLDTGCYNRLTEKEFALPSTVKIDSPGSSKYYKFHSCVLWPSLQQRYMKEYLLYIL